MRQLIYILLLAFSSYSYSEVKVSITYKVSTVHGCLYSKYSSLEGKIVDPIALGASLENSTCKVNGTTYTYKNLKVTTELISGWRFVDGKRYGRSRGAMVGFMGEATCPLGTEVNGQGICEKPKFCGSPEANSMLQSALEQCEAANGSFSSSCDEAGRTVNTDCSTGDDNGNNGNNGNNGGGSGGSGGGSGGSGGGSGGSGGGSGGSGGGNNSDSKCTPYSGNWPDCALSNVPADNTCDPSSINWPYCVRAEDDKPPCIIGGSNWPACSGLEFGTDNPLPIPSPGSSGTGTVTGKPNPTKPKDKNPAPVSNPNTNPDNNKDVVKSITNLNKDINQSLSALNNDLNKSNSDINNNLNDLKTNTSAINSSIHDLHNALNTGFENNGKSLDSLKSNLLGGLNSLGDRLVDNSDYNSRLITSAINNLGTTVEKSSCTSFNCTGTNQAQCYIARLEWERECANQKLFSSSGQGSKALNDFGEWVESNKGDHFVEGGDISTSLNKFTNANGFSFNGSCPQPRVINAKIASFTINYSPFCELASVLRVLILASATLFSVMMVVKHS